MFDDDEHEVKVRLHGNSKRLSKEYYRISHTIIEWLKELTKSDPPSIEVNGTISDFRNAAGHARNIKQIKNIKKTMEELLRDPLLELINMLKQGNRHRENAFVRKVETSSDPCVVLTTDQQLKDVERFCTNPSQFSILGKDPTFSFTTLTPYKHLLLRTKEDENPVRIGPTLIHHKKEPSSYDELSSTMIKLNGKTQNVRVYGTDG